MQVAVVEQTLGGTYRAPGEAACLCGMIDLLGRQAGDEVSDETIDDVGCACRDDSLVLVFGVLEITGHAEAVEQVRQVPDEPRVEPTADQRADICAVLGAELGAGCDAGGVMATCLSSQDLASVDVVGDCRLGRQGTCLVYRHIDILSLPCDGSMNQSRHDAHVSEVTARVPGVATARSDRRRIRHIRLVIAAGGHLATSRHVEQIA